MNSTLRTPHEGCTALALRWDYAYLDISAAVGKQHLTLPSFNLTNLCPGLKLQTGEASYSGGRVETRSQFFTQLHG